MGAGFPRQPGAMREQFLDGDAGVVGAGGLGAEPGQIGRDGVIEVDLSGVAELHDGSGGEKLGVRRHAEKRGRRHGSMRIEVGIPEAFRPDELLVVNHPDRDTGKIAVGDLDVNPTFEEPFGAPDFGIAGETGSVS